MANVRPISYANSSPPPPPNTLRINYRHNDWEKSQPWRSLDIHKEHLSSPDIIPEMIHKAFDELSASNTRMFSLDDDLDLARPSREVGITELDRIVRTQSVLVGGSKGKLDVTVHEGIKEPVRLPEATVPEDKIIPPPQQKQKRDGLTCSCQMS